MPSWKVRCLLQREGVSKTISLLKIASLEASVQSQIYKNLKTKTQCCVRSAALPKHFAQYICPVGNPLNDILNYIIEYNVVS